MRLPEDFPMSRRCWVLGALLVSLPMPAYAQQTDTAEQVKLGPRQQFTQIDEPYTDQIPERERRTSVVIVCGRPRSAFGRSLGDFTLELVLGGVGDHLHHTIRSNQNRDVQGRARRVYAGAAASLQPVRRAGKPGYTWTSHASTPPPRRR